MASGVVIKNAQGGQTSLDLSSWSQYDLSTTISGLFTDVVAHAGGSSVSQETGNSRVVVKMSNSGTNSGFLTKFPITNGLALHFASSSTVWSATGNFNNWYGCGFDERNFTATVSSINPFRFGWANNHAWTDLAMFFSAGGWMVSDGTECYFLADDYTIMAHMSLSTAPTNWWVSDQNQDTGGTTLYLYIDQIRYK